MTDIVKQGCLAWNLPVTEEALARMDAFAGLLIERNRVMNLTTITDPQEIARRHMLDCLSLLQFHDLQGKKIIDVGCGAGFPTMPLLCYDPTLKITALDSTLKRIAFIQDCCQQLQLPVQAICARAEEQAKVKGFDHAFDVALSRAVASMNVLVELCLPFLSVGGVFLAQKSNGPEAQAELDQAKKAIRLLGGEIEACLPYQIPGLDREQQIVVVRKIAKTPSLYPRRFAKITAKPL